MKANSPLINFILGYCINPMILNTMMTHDEQNPDEQNPDDHTSIDEDRQTPLSRNPQSTPKKFFKAICLSWSLSVSKSVSDNFTYILVFCLSTLTKLTTNFGLGVLPLGLYMTPTRWGLPKPVLTGRNAQLAKTLHKFSYRQQQMKTTTRIDELKSIYCESSLYRKLLITLSGDIELNPGPDRIITYNCRSLKESNKSIRKKQQLIEYMRKLTSQTDKYISDNLRLINLAIRQAERTCEPIYIIALDAKKAFDSVRHNFIYKILRRLGLHGFSEIFNLLYHEQNIRISLNGKLTDQYFPGRGVKQGDALSCIIFNLVIEIILRSINQDINITTLKIDNLKSNLPTAVGYADDITCIVKNSTDIQKVFSHYEKFTKVSGLELNADKN